MCNDILAVKKLFLRITDTGVGGFQTFKFSDENTITHVIFKNKVKMALFLGRKVLLLNLMNTLFSKTKLRWHCFLAAKLTIKLMHRVVIYKVYHKFPQHFAAQRALRARPNEK